MEPLLIMQTATVLLLLAALGGLAMAGMRFSGRPFPPPWLPLLHGFLAGAAVTLLIYAAATTGLPPLAFYALLLFLAAALGGVTMNLGYQWRRLPLPKWLVLVHAGVAAIGFALLVVETWFSDLI